MTCRIARASLVSAMALAAVMVGTAQDALTFKDVQARDAFGYARNSVMKTPGAITRLKTLRFRGKSRFALVDGSTADADVDIKILLPDHYLRVDSTPTGERHEGYAGSKVLNLVQSGGRTNAPPEAMQKEFLATERAQLARLLLGAATYVSTELGMTFWSRGTPVAMPGAPDPAALDVTDQRNTGLLRLVLEPDTRLPARIVFWGPERSALTMTFSDRRDVDGMLLPFRIATMADTKLMDALTFETIQVNPELTKADFAR